MRTTLKMPKLGDAAEKVVIVEILARIGDHISEGQTLFVIETDKSQMEVPAPSAGTVVGIHIEVGEEVPTGAPTLALDT